MRFEQFRPFLIVCLTLSLFSQCTPQEKMTAVTASSDAVYDLFYEKNKSQLDAIGSGLSNIMKGSNFGTPPHQMDSFDENLAKRITLEAGEPFLRSNDLNLTWGNTLLVWDITNKYLRTLEMDVKAQRLKKDSARNWLLTQPYDRGWIKSDHEFNGIWSRYWNKQRKKRNDLTKRDSVKLAGQVQLAYKALDSVKYVILIDDIIFLEPHAISSTQFDPGVIITKSEAYELYSGKLVTRNYHMSTNDSQVTFKEFGNSQKVRVALEGNPNLKLLSNLIISRNRTLMDDYAIYRPNGPLDLEIE